jgi:hypothetical protein
MQDKPNGAPPRDDLDTIQHLILRVLLDDRSPGIWSQVEVAQLVGDESTAALALVELHASGLIHHCHEFVFASRAAARFSELERAA